MSTIGILAYGSLIESPGHEIDPVIWERRKGVKTPFSIEFARSSFTRDGAPTVVPVESGGSPVHATILVLLDTVSQERAEDLLWRRETGNEYSDKHYVPQSIKDYSMRVVKHIQDFAGLDIVLYICFSANIVDLTPGKLAELAVKSAKANAGKSRKDGISYLMSLKRQGISTPLMKEYELEIIRKTSSASLEDAWAWCRKNKYNI